MDLEGVLSAAGWGGARHLPVAGDASTRRYLRLCRDDGQTAILMIAPVTTDAERESVAAFLRLADHLSGIGLSAPEILQADPVNGLILMEDLGEMPLSRLLETDPNAARTAYDAASRLPDALAGLPLPSHVARPDVAAQVGMMDLMLDRLPDPAIAGDLKPVFQSLLQEICSGPAPLSLRDYHGDNLMWLPMRRGLTRIGLLDFQDAVALPLGYDLASLLDDVRREVPASWRTAFIAEFACRHGLTKDEARARVDLLSLLRNLRILGVFDRLASEGGKPGYRQFVPWTRALIERAASNPALSPLKVHVTKILCLTEPWGRS